MNKEKQKEYQREYYQNPKNKTRINRVRRDKRNKNKEKVNEKNRIYREKNKEKVKRWYEKSRKKYPEKISSRDKAHNIPLKFSCEICDSKENLQRHHWRYDKPLMVNTLCLDCHKIQHQPKCERLCQ